MRIEITSPKDKNYNCIAWAAEDIENFWWPIGGYWPEGIPRVLNLQCFIFVYGAQGFVVTDSNDLEVGYKKIAIYIDPDGIPTHAARQLPNGKWTSKLGRSYDICHPFYKAWPNLEIDGMMQMLADSYGRLGVLMKKKS